MKQSTLEIEVTFTEPVLGLASGNPEIHEEYIAAKAKEASKIKEEVEAIDAQEEFEKALTVFPKDEKGIFFWDYHWRGYMKEVFTTLIEVGDIKTLTKWSVKKAVDSMLFTYPRRCYLLDSEGNNIPEAKDKMSRPLRAQTMQGERIALATSEMLPAGTKNRVKFMWIENNSTKGKMKISQDMIEAALDYGKLKGFGQWRGGGFGRFDWKAME